MSDTMEYEFELFANYHQVILEDDGDGSWDDALEDGWTEQAVIDMLVAVPHVISVSTARNSTVPVTVEVLDAEPPSGSFDAWDQVTECSIEVASGRLVVMGLTDWRPDAARIAVPPGVYAVRVLYGGLDTLDDLGLEGDDHYRVQLWPGEDRPVTVVKRYPKLLGG